MKTSNCKSNDENSFFLFLKWSYAKWILWVLFFTVYGCMHIELVDLHSKFVEKLHNSLNFSTSTCGSFSNPFANSKTFFRCNFRGNIVSRVHNWNERIESKAKGFCNSLIKQKTFGTHFFHVEFFITAITE